MKIEIIGKRHATGTAKATGKPFDFLEFHYLGKDRYGSVEGHVGKKFTVNPQMINYGSVQVGGTYDVDFDEMGSCCGMRPASKG